MTRIFICDNCKKEFPEPIERVQYMDEHSVLHGIDLCAPCSNLEKTKEKKAKDDFYSEILKKKG